jgi:hypothetical protein
MDSYDLFNTETQWQDNLELITKVILVIL